MLILLVAIGISAQTVSDSIKTSWNWPRGLVQSALDEGVTEYNLASKKVVAHKIESTILAIAILAGYLFFCFISTASSKIERLTMFNRVPIILINSAILISAIIFIGGDTTIINRLVVGIFGLFSLLIIVLAIFNRYWGPKTAFSATLAIVLPANAMLGVITSSWIVFLGSFVALLAITSTYLSIWGLITRILKQKEIEEGGGDDE